MKKETIALTLGLMFLLGGYIAIQNYYLKKQINHTISIPNQVGITNKPPVVLNTKPVVSALAPPVIPKALPLVVLNKDDLKLDTNLAHFEFTPMGGCLGQNQLKSEQVAYNDKTPVSVINNYNLCKAFGFKVDGLDLRTQPSGIVKLNSNTIQIAQHTDNFEIVRKIHFNANEYLGDFEVEIKNLSAQFAKHTVQFEMGAASDNKSAGGMFSMVPHQFHGVALRLTDGTIKREYTAFQQTPEQSVILNQNNVFATWINVDSLYWMNSLIPLFTSPLSYEVVRMNYNLLPNSTADQDVTQTSYESWVSQSVELQPGQSQIYKYKIYMGPKNETILKKYDAYHLEESIDYGFFKIIARPLYYMLNFLEDLVKNWGVAIILLTIIINIIFLPLQIKGFVSAQKMQVIQPQIKKLNEQYKEDKQTLHKETMALMSKSGVNPLSGCLPLLPQIPVFFGLNSTLQHTFDLRQSPFFFWIHDLTRPDPFFILPVIMAILMIGYQKMMPMPTMDPTQAKMMKFLPILFSVFMLVYPTGLALYVITNTVVSMVRQSILMRKFKLKV